LNGAVLDEIDLAADQFLNRVVESKVDVVETRTRTGEELGGKVDITAVRIKVSGGSGAEEP